MDFANLRALVIGAHPDDADTFAGGTAIKWASRGARVRFLSLCNGDKGWHLKPNDGVAARRRGEAAAAAKVYGIESYDIWDVSDCELEPTLELRKRLTREIRAFSPQVILTHRPCDYHADHRACAQLVQDVTYLLGIVNWCPDSPTSPERPAVFYMTDDFDCPRLLRPDVIVSVDDVIDRCLDGMACHVSQFFEFLPVDMGIDPSEIPSPADVDATRAYLDKWHAASKRTDAARFAECVAEWYGDGHLPRRVEAFEMSRYGRQLSERELREVFW